MNHVNSALRWAVFCVAAFAMNFPVISTLITSLKSNAEISSNPGLWIEKPTLENYVRVLEVTERLDIYSYLFNSTVASMIGAIAPILLAFPAAYAIARRGYGQNFLLPVIVNLRALPLVIFAIPLYMMYQWMGSDFCMAEGSFSSGVKRHLLLRVKATPSVTRTARFGGRTPPKSRRQNFARSGALFCQKFFEVAQPI